MAKVSTSGARDRHAIRFILDGELIELADVDPTRTVLQFLREDLRRTGTKEGCAEGDCGACTVAIAELDRSGDELSVRAINSCIQLLPTLDGKELITVESLARSADDPHPVQRAMVDCHASQCGFCTPGFVMSLFALYKTESQPTRRQIDDALAGNLCRCTGYRPIIAAAERMYSEPPGDDWLQQPGGRRQSSAGRVRRLQSIADDRSVTLGSNGRSFHAPATVEELDAILAANPAATILAGGTDVGLWVTKQHRDLDCIVYIGRVRELHASVVSDTHLEIGAAVSLTDVIPSILTYYPALDEVMLRFASPPIRNIATLAGNIANGSPIGDSMPALMVLQSSLVLRSAKGRREVNLEDFYKNYMVNDLQHGEFVETVRIPLPADGTLLRSYKVSKRFDQDISAICAAFLLTLDGGRVGSVRIAFGGMAATIRRAPQCEKSLTGQPWDEASIQRAMTALGNDFTPIDDMRATADYRLRVARNLLRRLLLDINGELDQTLYSYGRAG